jgi:[ribosomal protein S5]-alanine N-acetyltransferase
VPRLVPPALPADRLAACGQPVLDGGDLVLRPFTSEDAPFVVDAYGDPAIQHWHSHRYDSVAEAAEWITEMPGRWQSGSKGNWLVEQRPGGGPVGRVGAHFELREGWAEVSYWVAPRHRGGGVAPAAVGLAARWLLGDLGLRRLELRHATENAASCRVAAKAGFALEGTLGGAQCLADGWHDLHLHARLATNV